MDDAMTIKQTPRRLAAEDGATLIHVALALLALMGLSVFVVDYGVMWLARRQAQNAADAGALAGAIARAFDSPEDDPDTGFPVDEDAVTDHAVVAAQLNEVIGAEGGVLVSWSCPAYAAGGRCVQVDVHRDGEDIDGDGADDSEPVQTFFAQIFGIDSQPVRATATAWVAAANATNCMRPFAVADKWIDNVNPALNPKKFERWQKVGPTAVQLDPNDVYVPPSSGSTGTGYTVEADLGEPVTLKRGNPNQTADNNVEPGWSLPVRLPDGEGGYVSGANDFNAAIKHCIGNPVRVGDYLPTEDGVMSGPTTQGVSTDADSLINQDPSATWNTSTNSVDGSCAPTCAPFSPRIVPIAVFDMDEYQWRKAENNWTTAWEPGVGPGAGAFSCPTGGSCIRVTNIIGFFVESLTSADVLGRVAMYPGEFVLGPPSLTSGASFLVSIQLIR